jgi:hypothetical protein
MFGVFPIGRWVCSKKMLGGKGVSDWLVIKLLNCRIPIYNVFHNRLHKMVGSKLSGWPRI